MLEPDLRRYEGRAPEQHEQQRCGNNKIASGFSRFICSSSTFQNLQDIERIGAFAIVDAGVSKQDRKTVPIDEVGCRQRQRPVIRNAVLGRNIELEAVIDAAEVIREGVDQAERLPHFLANITQHRESKRVLLGGRDGVVRLFGADGDKVRARVADAGKNVLIGLKLEIAEWAPAAAIEIDDDRPFGQEARDVELLPVLISQLDRRRAITDLLGIFRNPAFRKMSNMPVHGGLPFGRHARSPVSAEFVKLLGECLFHLRSLPGLDCGRSTRMTRDAVTCASGDFR